MFSDSTIAGRREYRSGDLRDKLERRSPPNRRYSPGRDTRDHHVFHAQKPLARNRGKNFFLTTGSFSFPYACQLAAALQVSILIIVLKFL